MKTIIKDFSREFSVWQQQIEIEANLTTVKNELGIKCSLFFFANDSSGEITAYRIKSERDALPFQYISLAKQKNFSRKVFLSSQSMILDIKQTCLKISRGQANLDSRSLKNLRHKIIGLWPAYLYAYNLPRYFEKNIFKPKNQIEQDNLNWAVKLRKLTEGIYDYLESVIQQKIQPLLKNQCVWQKITTKEIYQLLDKGITVNKIPQRNDFFTVDYDGIHIMSLKEYFKLKKLILVTAKENLTKDVISGIVACKGFAKGKVTIVSKRNFDSFKRFKQGDILVAIATAPVFVPIMKKAAAIITNEGGLSSHAAIVARELNKPCIVGTKIATEILKDGDLVEVDANRGIVKILTKKQN